jgi:hypothetical protein
MMSARPKGLGFSPRAICITNTDFAASNIWVIDP